ncbi:hypothetical protein ACS0TY_015921 [Phlomoides rotata]
MTQTIARSTTLDRHFALEDSIGAIYAGFGASFFGGGGGGGSGGGKVTFIENSAVLFPACEFSVPVLRLENAPSVGAKTAGPVFESSLSLLKDYFAWKIPTLDMNNHEVLSLKFKPKESSRKTASIQIEKTDE